MRESEKRRKEKKLEQDVGPFRRPSNTAPPPILTLLRRPSLSLSKRRKMAVAAASTGTEEAAKGRIEAEAIEGSDWVFCACFFDSKLAVSKG